MKVLKKLFIVLFLFTFFMVTTNVHAEETGVIGEYDTIEEANEVAEKNKVDNDQEKVDTTVIEKPIEFIEDTKTLDEIYSDEEEAKKMAEQFKQDLINQGYEEKDSNIETISEDETSTEELDFSSVEDIIEYRKLLEDSGYKVTVKPTKVSYKTEETDKTEIDQTFTNMLSLSLYSLSLARTYNNFELQIQDNSYTVVNKDEDISKSFTSQLEALRYLISLARDYDITNPNITYEDVLKQETEHITNFYETLEDAENAYNNLISTDYTLENKEIKKLTVPEINTDKNNIINDLSLNNSTSHYNGVHGNSTNVSVIITDRNGNKTTSTGTAIINRVTVDETNHVAVSGISLFNINNNSVATVRGTITYCSNYRNVLGTRVCVRYTTSNFESYGIVNKDRNVDDAILTNNVFYYSMDSFDVQSGTVKDNLVKAYKLDVDKITEYTVPTYTLSAHIHDEDTINQYRLHGTVSRINIIPTYTVEVTKERTVEKYHTTSNMIKKATKNKYVVEYTKTIKENNTKAIVYNSSNPKTNDSVINYYIYLLISALGVSYILKKEKAFN